MRVNIYKEEITNRVELVTAQANGQRYCGVRFYLESSEKMYPPLHADDDTSAVTFWTGESQDFLIKVLKKAIETLENPY